MQKHTYQTTKTARFFSIGNFENPKEVWLVCHGYGQLANEFLKEFSALDTSNILIVAPEGLHRFYWGKFTGPVVASWMTKEERLDDIADYVRSINTCLEMVFERTGLSTELNVLGFSQGVATICRWLELGESKIPAKQAVFWAGSLAQDITYSNNPNFSDLKITAVYGTNDPFIQDKFEKYIEPIAHLNPKIISFEGKHHMHEATLESVICPAGR